jgi:heparan-alpha-glucosaminide N-acetyltransferase
MVWMIHTPTVRNGIVPFSKLNLPMSNANSVSPVPSSNRLASLDAYRGFVMLLMMGEVLKFCEVSRALPESGFWRFLCQHQSHVEWTGCSLHDLIQPSFSFLVGVALPYSIAARLARGQSRLRMTGHAVVRAFILILLGVFLRSTHASQTNWMFTDTLSQIGLGYVFLFLLGFRPMRDQWLALGAILIGYWAAFALYPLPGSDFDYASVGVKEGWPYHAHGLAAHWNKNSNLGWAFDTWFMNLFPRTKPWMFEPGGYSTLNFIPTLGTMVLGLLAGSVLHSERSPWAKVRWLLVTGVALLVMGWSLGALGICPVVKRIWTPSWTLFSGGWCCLILAAFYVVIDLRGWRAWSYPLLVIGMNSIAAYSVAHLFDGFVAQNLLTHLGKTFFQFAGSPYEPFLHGAAVLLVLWLMLLWMYRRKIFLRI